MPRGRLLWLMTGAALVLGQAAHWLGLTVADRITPYFPTVPDPLLRHLPVVQIGWAGEIFFIGIVGLFATYHFRRQPELTPKLFLAIGCLYFFRGFFLLLLPIGSPVGTPENAVHIYPYAHHSYFPGGHAGLIALFGFAIRDRRWSNVFLGLAAIFGIGSLFVRAHYTADILAGFLLAYSVAQLVDVRRSFTA